MEQHKESQEQSHLAAPSGPVPSALTVDAPPHTPGPWMVLPSVVPSQFVILTQHGLRQDIAVTYGFEDTPREANARLIAAAPELLAALIEVVNRPTRQASYEQARAAIRKATESAA